MDVVEGSRCLSAGDSSSDLTATVFVNDSKFYRRLVLGGDLGVADSLIAGEWSCDDLTKLVRIFIRAEESGRDMNGWTTTLRNQSARLVHWLRSNSIARSRRNIQQHYDLGNDFYKLWLDDTMSYSSGIFNDPLATMKKASLDKIDRLCRQLDLRANDHLLEIGTGWGALAIHAAQHYGCHVTTTTISDEQFEFARQRVSACDLTDRITLLKQDYREITGKFDKIVSVEMIEAVGHSYYDTFFSTCGRLLKRNGMMMMQAIVIADQHYERHIRSADFISQYIFPGGSLPSISALVNSAAAAAGMRCLCLDDFAPHYAETLRRWRGQFYRNIDQIRALGFDERFIRMWEYYLCYCEAAFDERRTNLVQLMLAKRECEHNGLPVADYEESIDSNLTHHFRPQGAV